MKLLSAAGDVSYYSDCLWYQNKTPFGKSCLWSCALYLIVSLLYNCYIIFIQCREYSHYTMENHYQRSGILAVKFLFHYCPLCLYYHCRCWRILDLSVIPGEWNHNYWSILVLGYSAALNVLAYNTLTKHTHAVLLYSNAKILECCSGDNTVNCCQKISPLVVPTKTKITNYF